jgi:undecaprenyl-diphosphatase
MVKKMKKRMKEFYLSVGLLAGFILWTIAVCFFDVQPIGPQGSSVGFAELNQYVHNLLGVHFDLYVITDWLGLVPLCVCVGFGILGLRQWIGRKKFAEVDRDLLVLGGFYIATMAVYVLFEIFVVNYRPVLIDGILEASFPSSTTMLTLCVMPTAIMQFNARIKNRILKQWVVRLTILFIFFMVIGRLVSGVHWITDIIGGILLSAGLVTMYDSVSGLR